MNDNAKILDQNPGPITPVQPVASVGIANKEMGPIGIAEIRPAGPEVKHEIDQESVELGVKEIQDRPDLTQIVDMQHAGPSVPVPPGPTGLVQISEKTDTSESNTWLNALTKKVQKVMQLMGF